MCGRTGCGVVEVDEAEVEVGVDVTGVFGCRVDDMSEEMTINEVGGTAHATVVTASNVGGDDGAAVDNALGRDLLSKANSSSTSASSWSTSSSSRSSRSSSAPVVEAVVSTEDGRLSVNECLAVAAAAEEDEDDNGGGMTVAAALLAPPG
jgi:hypothetical protein